MDLALLCKHLSILSDINLNGGLDFVYGQKENNCFQVTEIVNFCFVPNTHAASNHLTGQKDFLL